MRLHALAAVSRLADFICDKSVRSSIEGEARLTYEQYMEWSNLCRLVVDYDKPLYLSRQAVIKERITLEQHLMWNIGRAYCPLAVISAVGTRGVVTKIEWNRFAQTPDILRENPLENEYDIEDSWVTIQWNNGADSYDSVDNMRHIILDE